jgi:hypothetical protein
MTPAVSVTFRDRHGIITERHETITENHGINTENPVNFA